MNNAFGAPLELINYRGNNKTYDLFKSCSFLFFLFCIHNQLGILAGITFFFSDKTVIVVDNNGLPLRSSGTEYIKALFFFISERRIQDFSDGLLGRMVSVLIMVFRFVFL